LADPPVSASEPLPPETLHYYAQGQEALRLTRGHGVLELARTQELITRHLPGQPQVVLDVGGGPGTYACWLAALGHEVHLVDAIPLHIDQARAASARQPQHPLASITLGDARRLDWPDSSVDAVLLLGPLYHLTRREERLAALREAHRVLRPGGLLLAAAISRFASLLDGLVSGYLSDPDYLRIVEQDLAEGQHRNPTTRDYFTTAYFHRPEELEAEVLEAGFIQEALVGVEGPGWLLADLERRWSDPPQRAQLLAAARAVEGEAGLRGLSPHLIAVARKRRRIGFTAPG
jgi:ubiquinone/menaquinone biosynthesis C-methylase UbiE